MTRPARVLSIAGSDPSGGAGIQADLKTVSALGGYAMAVVTALTAQSPRGVSGVLPVDAGFVAAQLDAILADCPPDAVKIGMLGSAEVADVVRARLSALRVPVVLDPVLVATSGDSLAGEGVLGAIRALLPHVTLVTPNLPEVAALAGVEEPTSRESMTEAGRALLAQGTRAVLVKGGHLVGSTPDGVAGSAQVAADVLVDAAGQRWFEAPLVATANTHGTGCTLSSAIATGLGQGADLPEAVASAKRYLTRALASADRLGDWGAGVHGPVDHLWALAPGRDLGDGDR